MHFDRNERSMAICVSSAESSDHELPYCRGSARPNAPATHSLISSSYVCGTGAGCETGFRRRELKTRFIDSACGTGTETSTTRFMPCAIRYAEEAARPTFARWLKTV